MCSFGFVAADDADAIALAGYAGGAVGGMVPVHMEVTEGHGCKTQKGYSYMEAVEPKWLMHLIQHDVCCVNMNTIGNNVAIRFKNHDGSSMDQAKVAFCRSRVHRFEAVSNTRWKSSTSK